MWEVVEKLNLTKIKIMEYKPVPDGTVVELTGTFDAHNHFRKKNNGQMQTVVPDVLHEFGGGLIMPNPKPLITSIPLALAYREEVFSLIPPETEFEALFTCYLTDRATTKTGIAEVIEGFLRKIWAASKYMPNSGSTNTEEALTAFRNGYPLYEEMEKVGMPLLLHGETVGEHIDPFDAPMVFIENEMPELRKRFPKLPVVLEHITERTAAQYIEKAERDGEPTFATLTPQHMVFSRNRIFQRGKTSDGTFRRGSNPSWVCWPLLQRESPHQEALLNLVASGNKHVGLGSDRALHWWLEGKACEDGCGGCYFGRLNLPVYAIGFEMIGSFQHFQNFACINIPRGVYGLDVSKNKKRVRLIKDSEHPSIMPQTIGGGKGVPTLHGEGVPWRAEIVIN